MRVIAGKFRSRSLRSLRGQALRPTSDRLRETLFDILGGSVQGAVFADVFAGTGAVGIEALSRGAERVFFVEKHRAAGKLIAVNLVSLGISESAEILAVDAERGLETLAARGIKTDFVFLDPPYAKESDYARVLHLLGKGNFLAPASCVIAEHAKRIALAESYGKLTRSRVVTQGDAALSFYRVAD